MADIQAGPHPWVATGALLLALVSEGYDLQAANFAAPALVTSLGIAKAEIGPLWAIDHPYQPMKPAVDFLDGAPMSEAERHKLYHENAERIFHIAPL